jgi:hypothetical protein
MTLQYINTRSKDVILSHGGITNGYSRFEYTA